jgi:hypothetical protein
MCGVLEAFGAIGGLGLMLKGSQDARQAAAKAERQAASRAEELQKTIANQDELNSDVVDEVKSAVDSDQERLKRRRLGKRALRSIGLQGINVGGNQAPAASPSASASSSLGGI